MTEIKKWTRETKLLGYMFFFRFTQRNRNLAWVTLCANLLENLG
jgi:hypothetical protein